jgi:endonuclease/exonuclease/phosphatase family metal-dependent hydrolase
MRKEGFGPVDAVTQEFAGNGHIPDVRHVLDALANEVKPGEPVFWTGDFNVPSHLDWTPAAKDLHGGYVVPWPVSAMLDGAGFLDAYRVVHPDPVAQPGITWTPSKPLDDPEEVHDRIDFVYLRGDVRVEEAHVVGESEELADIVIEEFPSDHRGVVATVTLGVEQR